MSWKNRMVETLVLVTRCRPEKSSERLLKPPILHAPLRTSSTAASCTQCGKEIRPHFRRLLETRHATIIPFQSLSPEQTRQFSSLATISADRRRITSKRLAVADEIRRSFCTSNDMPPDLLAEIPDDNSGEPVGASEYPESAGKKRGRSKPKAKVTFSAPNNLTADQMLPGANAEIKSYMTKNDIGYTNGYTSYITTCPRYLKRRTKMKELNKMFINIKTGLLCSWC